MELAITSPDHGNGRKSLSREIRPDFINQGPPPAQDMHSDFAVPVAIHDHREFIWDDDDLLVRNYVAVGRQLAATGDLYRNSAYGSGLVLASTNPLVPAANITNGNDLAPLIAERMRVRVIKSGKERGVRIPSQHLGDMLKCEVFLQCFPALDGVISTPIYLPDFSLTTPGYNDAGSGHRYFYRGAPPDISNTLDTINRFLDVMEFASHADRTNAVAAALTVTLRNMFPGQKPAVVVTADKSHAGKDTIVRFAAGSQRITSISHEATDWPVERCFVGALKTNPDSAVINLENVRITGRNRFMASAFIERFITDPEPFLFSTGTGRPTRRRNDIVVAITTNEGTLSEDLMNRALPIHLTPVGNVADRRSAIGNPKEEFLPAHCKEIETQLHGMIERWKTAGQPLDKNVKHPFSGWAATVGGILAVNGFNDFLANYSFRKTADDNVRRGLALLGAARPKEWWPSVEWAQLTADLGLTNLLIPAADRESAKTRARGMGVQLSAHREETFLIETDDEQLTLRLEKARRRFESGKPETRYRFCVLSREQIPEDE